MQPPRTKAAHRIRPNVARTHCIECGRPIRAEGRSWLHVRRPSKGRPAYVARQPHEAARAVAAWHEANQAMFAGEQLRDEAFRQMVWAGMIAREIAEATAYSIPGVYHVAAQLGVEVTRVPRARSKSGRAALSRHSETGRSILFGD